MKKRIACLLFYTHLSGNQIETLARACAHLTPLIAIRQNNALFLEVGSCHNLYSEESVANELRRLALPLGPHEIAIAGSASRAYVLAKYPRTLEAELPLEALVDFATPFAEDPEASKEILRMIPLLGALGITRLARFRSLPKETLASRFGERALEIVERIHGRSDPAWPAFRVREPISESCAIEGIEPGIEPLLFSLRGILDRVLTRLATRSERLSRMTVEFEMLRWSTAVQLKTGGGKVRTRRWEIDLPVPQGNTAGVLPILRDYLLAQLEKRPLEAPLAGIRIEVLESVPGGGAQKNFFEKRELESEDWQALIGRLCQELGQKNVFQAVPEQRYRPEMTWSRRTPKNGPIATDGPARRFGRPSRLLPEPRPIARAGTHLSDPQGHRWRTSRWTGPERISGEWWTGGIERDYYQVSTESGEKLWVYRDGSQTSGEAFFLHGFFD